jgi:hypothetical protein
MHPLDLIKTRFQIQGKPGDPNHYNSIADCFRKMYRLEGYVAIDTLYIYFKLHIARLEENVYFEYNVACNQNVLIANKKGQF